MRRSALPIGGVLAALALAACGSSHHAPAGPRTVNASVIAKAAAKTAAQPGYAVDLDAHIRAKQIGGVATVTGSGGLPSSPLAGHLNLRLALPGELGLLGSFEVKVLLTNGVFYAKLPPGLVTELPGAKAWLSAPVTGIAKLVGIPAAEINQFDVATVLGLLAKDSTGTALDYGSATIDGVKTTRYSEKIKSDPGLTVYAWIQDTGLIRQLELIYTGTAGPTGTLVVKILHFGPQTLPAPPAADKTSPLLTAIAQLESAL